MADAETYPLEEARTLASKQDLDFAANTFCPITPDGKCNVRCVNLSKSYVRPSASSSKDATTVDPLFLVSNPRCYNFQFTGEV